MTAMEGSWHRADRGGAEILGMDQADERPVSAAAKQVYASPDSPILLSFDSYWRSGGNQRGHVAVHRHMTLGFRTAAARL